MDVYAHTHAHLSTFEYTQIRFICGCTELIIVCRYHTTVRFRQTWRER